jgi:hypothetical protein
MTVVNDSSHRNQHVDDGENNASKRGEHFHNICDIEDLAIEFAEYEDRIKGPQKCNVGDQVREEFHHQTGHLIRHSVSFDENDLKFMIFQEYFIPCWTNNGRKCLHSQLE